MKKLIYSLLFIMLCTAAQTQQSWVQKANLPYAAYYLNSFTINDTAYVGLGATDVFNSHYSDEFYRYDALSNEWDTVAVFPGGGRYSATTFSINGKGYVCFGVNEYYECTREVWQFDPDSNLWTRKEDFPGNIRYGAASFVIGGKAYISGGSYNVGNDFLGDHWCYDPEADQWSQKSSIPIGHLAYSAGISFHNKGYLITGAYESQVAVHEVWQYDPQEDSWSPFPALPEVPRGSATGLIINDQLVVGTGTDCYLTFRTFWTFDSLYQDWFPIDALPLEAECRYAATSFNIGNTGYIVGGRNEHPPNYGMTLSDTWAYEVQTGIEINEHNPIKLFPNPSSGVFYVQFPENKRQPTYSDVYDVLGNRVMIGELNGLEPTKVIDLSGLNPGLYLIHFHGPDVSYDLKKVVISR